MSASPQKTLKFQYRTIVRTNPKKGRFLKCAPTKGEKERDKAGEKKQKHKNTRIDKR